MAKLAPALKEGDAQNMGPSIQELEAQIARNNAMIETGNYNGLADLFEQAKFARNELVGAKDPELPSDTVPDNIRPLGQQSNERTQKAADEHDQDARHAA